MGKDWYQEYLDEIDNSSRETWWQAIKTVIKKLLGRNRR